MNRHHRRAHSKLADARNRVAMAAGNLAFVTWATKAGCTLDVATDADRFPLRTDDDFQRAEAELAEVVRQQTEQALRDMAIRMTEDERTVFVLAVSIEANREFQVMATRFIDACADRVAGILAA